MSFDYLIVGAGPSGLCAAKTILECEPHAKVKLVDANKTLGGVWAKEKLYPGLKTNNLRGTLDFSDFPMHDGFGVLDGHHPTGEAMHEYYEAYAERSDLLARIDFQVEVTEVSRLEDGQGWRVKMQSNDARSPSSSPSPSPSTSEVQTQKLIIATGVTNHPHRPTLSGSSTFAAPIIHSGELGAKGASMLLDDASIKTVAVLGGGKSAYDAVHLAGRAGHQVEWIIRRSGKGPEWVFPSHTTMGPFSVPREWLSTRRIVSFFSPCLWNDGFAGIRRFLHGTALGRFVAQKFWARLHAATLADCGMLKDEATKVLEPETSPFWYGTASGVYNFEKDVYEMLKTGQVRVHREDINRLTAHTIHLSNGAALEADALITATGFSPKPTLDFSPATSHSDLGVPSTSLTASQTQFWHSLDTQADERISTSFPRLLAGPFLSPSSPITRPFNAGLDAELHRTTPFRLYRAIAPPGLTVQGDRSLAFVSMFSNVANTPRCELQCLWAYAYLTHRLDDAIPAAAAVWSDTALMARYARYRAPYGHGRFFPDLVFDQVPYFDLLLQDLGVPYWRKGNLFAEVLSPYRGTDYRGVVREWFERVSNKETTAAKGDGSETETQPLLGAKG